jgi:hypothetical protein
MKRESGGHDRPREARLRPESAHLFPGVPSGVWVQAATMSDIVWSRRLQRAEPADFSTRVLSPEHFEFRHGGEEGESTVLRRRATDRLREGD